MAKVNSSSYAQYPPLTDSRISLSSIISPLPTVSLPSVNIQNLTTTYLLHWWYPGPLTIFSYLAYCYCFLTGLKKIIIGFLSSLLHFFQSIPTIVILLEPSQSMVFIYIKSPHALLFHSKSRSTYCDLEGRPSEPLLAPWSSLPPRWFSQPFSVILAHLVDVWTYKECLCFRIFAFPIFSSWNILLQDTPWLSLSLLSSSLFRCQYSS